VEVEVEGGGVGGRREGGGGGRGGLEDVCVDGFERC
jgi:hypothetical protein